MSKPYSLDLRERVVEFVEAGASRHEAAECFMVSVSSAIRWMPAPSTTNFSSCAHRSGSSAAFWSSSRPRIRRSRVANRPADGSLVSFVCRGFFWPKCAAPSS